MFISISPINKLINFLIVKAFIIKQFWYFKCDKPIRKKNQYQQIYFNCSLKRLLNLISIRKISLWFHASIGSYTDQKDIEIIIYFFSSSFPHLLGNILTKDILRWIWIFFDSFFAHFLGFLVIRNNCLLVCLLASFFFNCYFANLLGFILIGNLFQSILMFVTDFSYISLLLYQSKFLSSLTKKTIKRGFFYF